MIRHLKNARDTTVKSRSQAMVTLKTSICVTRWIKSEEKSR
ncbi:MAG: hypothetical protein ABJN75_05160 [Hoeflea sp.]|jgi:hypothetical protein|uniref:Uncharacterized protein n=1 Tax=Hoeflea algicola TaxID=2983763 RepID=A0ABT3ZFV5_9HYPH|nr:hypothetical protein [Hoeflea algicola]MCY0150686.1 hypothetical protein [Hoeflea algicola]